MILPISQDTAQMYIQLLPMSRATLETNLKDPDSGEMGECGPESPMIPTMSFMATQLSSWDHCGMAGGLGLLPILLIAGSQQYGIHDNLNFLVLIILVCRNTPAHPN